MQTRNATAPAADFIALPQGIPSKAYPLTALLPQKWQATTGERVRVQGSPGFQVVYVSVDGEVIAVPLDVAAAVGRALTEHARCAALRTAAHLQLRGRA